MDMELMTGCGRCRALVETRREDFADGTTAHYMPCAAVAEVGTDGATSGDGIEYTALCHDCIGQLMDWLAGESDALQNPQASTDGVAALVRDMAVALDFSRDSAWCSCRYFHHSEDCRGCPADGSGQPCHHVLFDDIRRRCEALGIDLEGDEDEK